VRTELILGALAAISLAAACEKTVDPRTGERTFQLSMPMTPEHRDRLERRWQECIRFRSQSVCDQRHPGGRPTRGSSPRAAPAESSAADPASADPAANQSDPAARQ
jgi:hypothetical protein